MVDSKEVFERLLFSGPEHKSVFLFGATAEFYFSTATLLQALKKDDTRRYLDGLVSFLKEKKGYTIPYHKHYLHLFETMQRFYTFGEDLYVSLLPRASNPPSVDSSSPSEGPPTTYGSLRLLGFDKVSGVNFHQVEELQDWVEKLHTQMCIVDRYLKDVPTYADISRRRL